MKEREAISADWNEKKNNLWVWGCLFNYHIDWWIWQSGILTSVVAFPLKLKISLPCLQLPGSSRPFHSINLSWEQVFGQNFALGMAQHFWFLKVTPDLQVCATITYRPTFMMSFLLRGIWRWTWECLWYTEVLWSLKQLQEKQIRH